MFDSSQNLQLIIGDSQQSSRVGYIRFSEHKTLELPVSYPALMTLAIRKKNPGEALDQPLALTVEHRPNPPNSFTFRVRAGCKQVFGHAYLIPNGAKQFLNEHTYLCASATSRIKIYGIFANY